MREIRLYLDREDPIALWSMTHYGGHSTKYVVTFSNKGKKLSMVIGDDLRLQRRIMGGVVLVDPLGGLTTKNRTLCTVSNLDKLEPRVDYQPLLWDY